MVTVNESGGFVSQPDQPLYNVKAVCQRTEISAATLRAWEHRYGIPKPKRTENGYRLYSEQDITMLIWLRQQIDQGMTVSRAARQLQHILAGEDQISPEELSLRTADTPVPVRGVRSPESLCQELTEALVAGDQPAAERLLSEALALYTPETALLHVLYKAVNALRTARHANTISAGTEYTGLGYVLQRLTNFNQFGPQPNVLDKAVITIGFSAERAEIDLLILDILLRRRGLPVTHLGADLEPRMLESALAPLNAGLVVFYANDPKNVERLVDLSLTNGYESVPIVCCGQALLTESAKSTHLPVTYLGADLHAVAEQISTMLSGQKGTT
jgi:MerR family transcriptional regulator, light-induced transcriptional regulator